MSEEETKNLMIKDISDYIIPYLMNIDKRVEELHEDIEKLREDAKKEHEDLLIRAVNAETKLKLYEGLFSKLNLNMEVKNGLQQSNGGGCN